MSESVWDPDRSGVLKKSASPFPHLILDQAIPAHVLHQIDAHWPGTDKFEPEVPGNYIFKCSHGNRETMPPAQVEFWTKFYDDYFARLIQFCFRHFAPVLEHRFGKIDRLLFGHGVVVLMDAEPDENFHFIHTHYYHDPNFLFTMLLYVDEGYHGFMGTHLYAAKSELAEDRDYVIELARAALPPEQHENWESKPISFLPSRLVAFLDGPLSFHAVPRMPEHLRTGETRGRRIVRAHIMHPHSPFIESRYGVSWGEYKDVFWNDRAARESEQVREWVARDIDEHFHPNVVTPLFNEPEPPRPIQLPQIFENQGVLIKDFNLGTE